MPENDDFPPAIRREHVAARIHILDGYVSAFERRAEISQMVCNCVSAEEAFVRLVAAPFGYSEVQAHHILDQPLRLQTLERLRAVESERQGLTGGI
jgi:DNA gyrase/topoisomerase IV subunit A